MTPSVTTVFWAAMITAVATGVGALPFYFFKTISRRTLGVANALAAGLMLGASIGLIVEGWSFSVLRLGIGLVLGVVLILVTRSYLNKREDVDIGSIQGAGARDILLIMVVMTVHSFAEGIGVGVSWGDGEVLGGLITAAIAVHNIPEGLAISLVLIPRGVKVWKSGLWSIFSSLPQPLMAVPAFLFVLFFRPFLPVGLGLAAGAMIWMVFTELLPDALEDISLNTASVAMVTAVIAMLGFQLVIG